MPHHSSSLFLYRACPHAYALGKKNPDAKGWAAYFDRGSAVHKAAEVILISLRDGLSLPEAKEKGRAAVEAMRGELSGEGLDQADFFLRRLDRWPFEAPAAGEKWLIEEPFAVDRDWNLLPTVRGQKPPAGTFYYGRIDFAILNVEEGWWKTLDWKSSRQVESIGKLRTNVQLSGYGAYVDLLMQKLGVDNPTGTIGRLYPTVGVFQQYTLTDEERVGLRKRVEDEVRAVEADAVFEPRPEIMKCASCPVRYLCKSWTAAGTGDIELATPEDAARAWNEMQLLEAKGEDLRLRVKAWIAHKGPIPLGNGKVVDFKPVEKRKVRDDAVETLMETRGIEAERLVKVMNLTVKGLELLADEDEALIESCVDRTTESRLSVIEEGK